MIEESKLELKAAIDEYKRLSKEVFPKLKLGLLHGRLSSEEKDAVMESFRKNETQILVSTTVIEVGVDVPNATVMVIEHAERFGLAQLHQLRGRIGRGAAKSHCILVAPARSTDDARARLETMVRTANGFEIAETDLNSAAPANFSAPANPATSASTSPTPSATKTSSKSPAAKPSPSSTTPNTPRPPTPPAHAPRRMATPLPPSPHRLRMRGLYLDQRVCRRPSCSGRTGGLDD